ncbi:MAG: hypothetical protein QOI98_1337 [Solirubrobacteraceae bacterium]|jgi:uncharacterized cupin superfamily protein|nr:hypothetical protein [Solirubrobacteraceae bacterium]
MSESCLIHWDDVAPVRRDAGPLSGAWRPLGEAAGTIGVGLRRIEIDPGMRSTPVHRHTAEEEFFFVLGGSGLSWQDGKTYEVGVSDCILHKVEEEAHTLIAGPDGLDVLAFGPRRDGLLTVLPRAGVAWAGGQWVELAGGATPWEREAAAGELDVPDPSPRPPTILALDDVPVTRNEHGRVSNVRRDFGDNMGAVTTGLGHLIVTPGRRCYPMHCHSAEEELFVVLMGSGKVLLGDDEQPVRAGHVVSRPPGTGVAHAFEAGEEELVLLAYGTRDPNDIAYYPDSNKISFRGVGLMARIERLDYWDGEE